MVSVPGRAFHLVAAGYEADVVSVGATLRRLTSRGRDLVLPFEAAQVRPAMSGTLLAPWPNRVGDGRYVFGGATHQLDVNEVDLGNATHGLVAWSDFDGHQDGPDHVRLTTTIEPRPGYPWCVDLSVDLTLGEPGLRQEVTAVNRSGSPAPFGVGGHPYLLAGPPGERALDAWFLEVPAERVLTTDERRLPVGEVAVAGALDFRARRPVGDVVLDRSFTGLRAGPDGLVRVRVTDAGGRGAELVLDRRCPWVHVYSADLSTGAAHRAALAVEPLTCPPDAFRSGRDLIGLAPGASTTAGWTIRAVGGGGDVASD